MGGIKIISFYAKKARSMIVSIVLGNKILHPEQLNIIDLDGYHFAPSLSSGYSLIFLRDHKNYL